MCSMCADFHRDGPVRCACACHWPRVVDVRPSAWWDNGRVILLGCGHRHVRPASIVPAVGDRFRCCFCEDGSPVQDFQAVEDLEIAAAVYGLKVLRVSSE